MDAYSILFGTGSLYVAPTGSTFPAVDSAPASPWVSLGETSDGVEIEIEEDIEEFGTDQRTGAVAAARTSEKLTISTKLVEANLENLAAVLGVTVTDTAPGSGTIGTRAMPLYRGGKIAEFAAVYRGKSPYGDWNEQFEFPRGYFTVEGPLAYKKDEPVTYEIKFHLLEDLNASTASARYGRRVAQDAAAL